MRYFTLVLFFVSLTATLSLTACAQKHGQAQNTDGATQGQTASMTTHVDGNPAHYDLSAYPSASEKVQKTNAQWKAQLTEEQYEVLRDEGTERPGSGALLNNHEAGIFKCAGCGNALFASQTKFESGTGWPSFWAPIEQGRVKEITDNTLGMSRTEVQCARCGGHLGHVFDDGPKPTGLRYCMNSAALAFDRK